MHIRSFICGEWVEGTGERAQLVNPTTEEVVADAATGGIENSGQALAYAREKGGAALAAATFAERGKMLGAMASAIHAHREALVDLAIANGGNTRGDAKFDIDGATGTLSAYAAIGESLGDKRLLVDGDMVQLGRNPRYAGQHVFASRTGAAIHINAFNFPAWGFGEKAAVALLAGMPVVVKPATSTAVVAARIAEILVDSGVVPDGVFSFIGGGIGDLLDHVTSQDVIAFTGSSDTGAMIRGRDNVVRQSVRVNIEADSLNAAVLGPDVDLDSDTYDLFLREVARDITQKAGQKCTAIRRVYAPSAVADQVRDDLADRLRSVKVGDPARSEVKMGPVSTARQLRDVREGLDRLAAAATLVVGGTERGELIGVEPGKGYFVAPTLFYSTDMASSAVNDFEVFGPSATLMPYDGDPVQAIRLGGGGLVASVYSDDRAFIERMILGIAPYHGRLTIGGDKIAEHSMGPGTVLPHLVHGGPGRAGGGEELGAARGMALYMQRLAVQGYKPMLERVLGVT